MIKAGIISNFDEVRWDVRPSPKFGTLEFRVAKMLPLISLRWGWWLRFRSAWSNTSRASTTPGARFPTCHVVCQ